MTRRRIAEGGIRRALYPDLQMFAMSCSPLITLEVNRWPPNPGSITVHATPGFHRAGTPVYDGNEVVMLELALNPASSSLPGQG